MESAVQPNRPASTKGPAVPNTTHSALDDVDLPVASSEVLLASGRRYSVQAEPSGDRLTVRSRSGEVVLRVTFTDAGPVLSFEAAEVELTSPRKLTLSAGEVSIEAGRSMAVRVGGDMSQTIEGSRHTQVGGTDKLEAAAVQMQSSTGAFEVRSAGRIGLDGEHIGLNDDECLQPFGWSTLADGPGPAEK